MIIACLHTADSNIPIFEAACPEGVKLTHRVRPDLLARAIAAGGATEEVLAETAEELGALTGDAILLTCSSIGAAAPRSGALRVDTALAKAAAAAGGTVEVFVTTPSTIQPTGDLFRQEGVEPKVTLIDGALTAFQENRLDDYLNLIAAAADRSTADVVALAQASMAPAAEQMRRPALTSPAAGLRAAAKAHS